uniref:G_PROTEIN_RECEP_F1_2 domain-containing protein n=1 Tax=Rhabditophanes sp. KR3021 TaxID=114890 RepID=A0AC35U9Y6_9BILA
MTTARPHSDNSLSSNLISITTDTTKERSVNSDELSNSFDDTHFILPLIITFGLVGNIISLATIFNSRLRKTNAHAYLLVLTAADSVFLLVLTLILFKVDFWTYEFCAVIEYLLSSTSTISSWSIASLTIERFCAVNYPLIHVTYGHISRARLIVYWLPFPFIYNLIYFFGLVASTEERERCCYLKPNMVGSIITIGDIIINYVFPCMIVVVLNLLIAAKMATSRNYFHMAKETKIEKTNLSIPTVVSGLSRSFDDVPALPTNVVKEISSQRIHKRSGTNTTRTATILWMLPLIYMILNTPFYVLQIIENFYGEELYAFVQKNRSSTMNAIFNMPLYLYYFNFASDVIVYAFSSRIFRKSAIQVWKRLLCNPVKSNMNEGFGYREDSAFVSKNEPKLLIRDDIIKRAKSVTYFDAPKNRKKNTFSYSQENGFKNKNNKISLENVVKKEINDGSSAFIVRV